MPTLKNKKVVKKRVRKRKPLKPNQGEVESTLEEESLPTTEGESEDVEVLYPDFEARLCIGDKALTREDAQKLLGWQMESQNVKFGNNYFLKDLSGVKIRCYNNTINVPYYPKNMEEIKQEILRFKTDGKRAWNFNGEPIIIGKTGKILNGQHTLIALILACQEWDLNPGKWIEWQEEPTIDKLVVFGVDEDDDTVNSLDTCRGRTQADVFYRSEFFSGVEQRDRKPLSRVCSYAVNTVWERTGAEHAFAPRQTFSVAVDFIRNHPRILEASEHIYNENNDNSIGKYLSLGYAAGMLYLMGCSTANPQEYLVNPTESSLDWDNWDKACEFFVLLANEAKALSSVKAALAQMLNDDGGSRKERLALLAKAWVQFASKGEVGKVRLKYQVENEVRTLAENPSVGGIDLLEREK